MSSPYTFRLLYIKRSTFMAMEENYIVNKLNSMYDSIYSWFSLQIKQYIINRYLFRTVHNDYVLYYCIDKRAILLKKIKIMPRDIKHMFTTTGIAR